MGTRSKLKWIISINSIYYKVSKKIQRNHKHGHQYATLHFLVPFILKNRINDLWMVVLEQRMSFTSHWIPHLMRHQMGTLDSLHRGVAIIGTKSCAKQLLPTLPGVTTVVHHSLLVQSKHPGLDLTDRVLTRTLQSGDTLFVWHLDRLGRSMSHWVVTGRRIAR